MTVGAKPGTSKPRGDMDFLSGDHSNGPLYDHTVSGEVNMMDNTIFASSPNSLYMYEQEKNDMQSFSDTSCNGSMTSLLNEEPFELKSQYENSCDISMPASGGSTVTTTSSATGTFSDSSWVNNAASQSSSSNLVKSEEFEPTLAELNTVTSEENTMMDISSITDYISPENMQQLDLLLSAAQQSFTNGENSSATGEQQNSSDRGRSNSASEMPRTWTTTSRTQDNKPVFSGDIKPSYQRQPLPSHRLRHSSASSFSNKHPQKSTIESSQLHELLSRSIRPVTVTTMENSVATSTPSQLSPGKRKLAMFPEEGSNSVDKKWEEIKQLLYPEEKHSPCRSKCKRQSLDSTSSAPSFEDSDSDSDVNDFSDSDSEGSQEEWNAGRSSRESRQHRKDQYFWQYNIQSKGPKGKRVKFGMEENPHKVQDFEDPVFDSSSASQLGTTIRHGGKARKGDGNDVSPNPKKLVQIGSQIKKLNKQINSFAPLSELPVSTRNKSKKEKNKLASRACRLKKKAQHEANKVKLYGLDIEHKQLLNVIDTIKEDLHNFIVKKGPQLKFSTRLQSLVKENLTIQVAGNTTEYVNTVITKVEAGDPKGGLDSSKKSRVQNEHT